MATFSANFIPTGCYKLGLSRYSLLVVKMYYKNNLDRSRSSRRSNYRGKCMRCGRKNSLMSNSYHSSNRWMIDDILKLV